jgi:signal transduction histidine kinase
MRIGDAEVLGLTLRQLIGGRWAVSWILYLINLPLNFLGMSSHIVDARSADVLSWVLVWLIAYVIFGLVLLAAHLTVLRNRRTTPVAVGMVIAVGAIAGGLRGLLVGTLADAWGLSPGDWDVVAIRTVTGMVVGLILLPMGAFFLALISEYHRQRSALVAAMSELESQRMRAEGESDALRELLVAQIAEHINDDSLSIRSASHRVWPDPAPLARVQWREVVTTSLVHNPFPGVAVALIWAASAFLTVIAAIGPIRGSLQVAASAVAIWAIFLVARRHTPRGTLAGFVYFLGVMAVTVIVTGPIASLVFDPRPFGAGSAMIIANSIWLPLFTVLASVCIGAVRSGQEVLNRLHARVDADEVVAYAAQCEKERLQRAIAESLHSMQSRVYTARLTGNEVMQLADLVPSSDELRTPAEVIESLLAPWASIIELTLHLPDAPLSLTEARSVKRIVQEGLTNAYRHGQATACTISIARDDGGVDVQVQDNGAGLRLDRAATRGLGSAILDEACPGQWKLTQQAAGGCLLSARLP